MGMKDWLEKGKRKLEEKLEQAQDPQAQKDAKKQDAKKAAERVTKALKLAKQGLDKYNEVAKKVDDAATDVSQKAIDLAEKAKPIAEKIDGAAAELADQAKEALNGAIKKAEEIKRDNINKPSTGSGILDLLSPAVPETDAAKNPAPPKKNEPPKPA